MCDDVIQPVAVLDYAVQTFIRCKLGIGPLFGMQSQNYRCAGQT